MPKLSEISKTLYRSNKSSWDKYWNKDIQKILDNENQDLEIVSAGETFDYHNNQYNSLLKYYSNFLNKINYRFSFNLSLLFTILLNIGFIIVAFYFAKSSILKYYFLEKYETFNIIFYLFYVSMIILISIYISYISIILLYRFVLECKSIFYILTPENINFY